MRQYPIIYKIPNKVRNGQSISSTWRNALWNINKKYKNNKRDYIRKIIFRAAKDEKLTLQEFKIIANRALNKL